MNRRGFEREGRSLLDAIEAGSTGTEIHKALRENLRRVSDDARLDAALRAAAQQLALEITAALAK